MDLEAVRKKLQKLQTKTQKQDNLWKPEPGNQVIRIVPNKSNPEYPFHELYFHYGLGGKTYLSPTSVNTTLIPFLSKAFIIPKLLILVNTTVSFLSNPNSFK